VSELRKVRVSINPSEELEVTEAEYTDLRRQGLVVNAKGEPVKQTEPTVKKKES
jgi:hypothetical protein